LYESALQVVAGLLTCERTLWNTDNKCRKMSLFVTVFLQGDYCRKKRFSQQVDLELYTENA
jgi:hypothetical protein